MDTTWNTIKYINRPYIQTRPIIKTRWRLPESSGNRWWNAPSRCGWKLIWLSFPHLQLSSILRSSQNARVFIYSIQSSLIPALIYLLLEYNVGKMAAASVESMAPQWPLKEANQPLPTKQDSKLTHIDYLHFSYSTDYLTGACGMGPMACGILILLHYGLQKSRPLVCKTACCFYDDLFFTVKVCFYHVVWASYLKEQHLSNGLELRFSRLWSWRSLYRRMLRDISRSSLRSFYNGCPSGHLPVF